VRFADRERGFVAIEWVTAVALLLFPVVVLVATMPSWAERRHAATVAAREGAAAAVAGDNVDPEAARAVATEVAARYGIGADAVTVEVEATGGRRGYVTVLVHVQMPAIAVPGLAEVGGWTYTARQHRRLDDYRSL
jgi:hypothetical protein